MSDWTPKTIPVGWTCRYFSRGDTNRPPLAGLVTGSSKDGSVDLTIFAPNARHHRLETGVRHRNDPYLQDRPQHAYENGSWDYLEPLPCDGTPEVARDVNQTLLDLHREYGDGSATKIAVAMSQITGEEWSYQKVNMRLRKLQQSPKREPEPAAAL
jgi:hypothetical protein